MAVLTRGYDKKLADRYYRESEQFRKRYGATEMLGLWRLVGPSLKGKTVLAAGVGHGREAALLSRKGATVFGVDASRAMIQIAKEKHPRLAPRLSVANIRKLPFRDKFFDLIFCKFVLHYLPSPDAAFKEFSRCLKKNGTLIFWVHHPVSVLLFKKSKDYFRKEPITVAIFNRVAVTQPGHTFGDYLSEYFLGHFDVQHLREGKDLESLHPHWNVPEYLMVKAQKR